MFEKESKPDLQVVLSEAFSAIRTETDLSDKTFEDYAQASVEFTLDSWQRDHFLPFLGGAATTKRRKIMIHAPPQAGKSIFMSGRYPAFLLGMNPLRKVCLCAYNEDAAIDFSRLVIETIRSDAHQEFFGHDLRSMPQGSAGSPPSAKAWRTQARQALADTQYSVKAVGLITGVVGKGFDDIIIDDPYASYEDSVSEATNKRLMYLYKKVIRPRLKDGNLYWMFHRWHPNDIIGLILKDEPGEWEYMRFPEMMDKNLDGSDPTGRQVGELLSPRMNMEDSLRVIEKDPGTWMSLHQGTPTAEEGGLIRPDEWIYINQDELPGYDKEKAPWGDFRRFYRSWDLATSKKEQRDHTAGVLMANDGEDIYILDMDRFQEEWPEVEDRILSHAVTDPANTITLVEQVAMSLIAVQSLKRRKEFRGRALLGVVTSKDKRQNALGWASRTNRGKIYVVRGPWQADFVDECRVFDGLGLAPDDQVDSVSIGFRLVWGFGAGPKKNEQKPAWLSHAWLREMRRLKKNAERQRKEEYGDPEQAWDHGDAAQG